MIIGPDDDTGRDDDDDVTDEPIDCKPCPFCAGEDLELASIRDDREEGYAVSCAGCGTDGPFKPTERAAERAWNERVPE
jgi:Lar family restriction alleviation protein